MTPESRAAFEAWFATLYKPWKLDEEELAEKAWEAGAASRQPEIDLLEGQLEWAGWGDDL